MKFHTTSSPINHFISAVFLILAFLIAGCQNESIQQSCEGDNAQTITSFYSEEFDKIPCSLQSIEEDMANLVIIDQIQYEKYISCSTDISVDFEKYIVLAGVYQHHQCARLENQEVSICNGRIKYNVNLNELDCHALTKIFYLAVIEREYNILPIDFDVRF